MDGRARDHAEIELEMAKLREMRREIGEWIDLYEGLLAQGMSPERAYELVVAYSEEQGESEQADQERLGGRDVPDHIEDDVQDQDQQREQPAQSDGRPGTVHAMPPSPGATSGQAELPTVGLSCYECGFEPLLATYEIETDSWVLRCSNCGWLNRIGPVYDPPRPGPQTPSARPEAAEGAPVEAPSDPATPSGPRSSDRPASPAPGPPAAEPGSAPSERRRPRRPGASIPSVGGSAPVQAVESSNLDTSTITSTTEDRLLSVCRHCGAPVWRLEHWMTHGQETFEIMPADDGEAMLDFENGLYTILQPVVGASGKSKKRKRPATTSKQLVGEGPYRYHMTRCRAAAEVFGWRKPA